MTCETATNLISSRIDGEISAAEAKMLDEHLATCAGCRATMETLSAQDADLTRSLPADKRRPPWRMRRSHASIARTFNRFGRVVFPFSPRFFPPPQDSAVAILIPSSMAKNAGWKWWGDR
jgi:anti-sigma factor RsiW